MKLWHISMDAFKTMRSFLFLIPSIFKAVIIDFGMAPLVSTTICSASYALAPCIPWSFGINRMYLLSLFCLSWLTKFPSSWWTVVSVTKTY